MDVFSAKMKTMQVFSLSEITRTNTHMLLSAMLHVKHPKTMP